MSIEVTSNALDNNGSTGDENLDALINQTMEDSTTYGNDELAYEASKSQLQKDIDAMMQMSANGSDECFAYIIMVIFPDMMDCGEMQIKMESDCMAIGVDAKNLTLYSQDEYNAILAGDTGADATADAEGMVNSLNMLLGTDSQNPEYMFTITYYDDKGNVVNQFDQINGLLDLWTDPSGKGYWPGGLTPMSAGDAASIEEAASGIIKSIGDSLWTDASSKNANDADYNDIVDEIQGWIPTSENSTNDNGNEINDQSANMEDEANSAYSQMLSSEDQNYQKQQTYMQTIINCYNETADSMSMMMQDYNSMLAQQNQKMGG